MTVQPASGSWVADAVHQVVWNALVNGDSGSPVDDGTQLVHTIQVEGTAGAGFTFVMEGSNDGTNYRTMTDMFGLPMSYTAIGFIAFFTSAVRKVRPRVTAGDGTTTATVTMLSRASV